MKRARDEDIREGFYFGLMQMVGRSGMTALETTMQDEQRMRLVGPHLGRIQREFLSPSIQQRFALAWREGWLPAPPPELHGHDLKVDYVSPMANAQKSAQAAGTMRLIDSTIAMAKIKPEVVDNLNEDAAFRYLREGFTAPVELENSPDVVAQKRQQRMQEQQAQQQLAMGQQGADIAQKMSTIVHPRNMGQAA